jgi:hypothetical protein
MNQIWNKTKRCVTVPYARLGWLLIVLGIVLWQVFGRYADWSSVLSFWGPLQRTNGVVIATNQGGFAIGDGSPLNPIHEVRFTFNGLDGVQHQGVSWTDSSPPRGGDAIDVEFVASEPDTARIVNFRSGPLPLWIGLVSSLPIYGVWCILHAVFTRAEGDRLNDD